MSLSLRVYVCATPDDDTWCRAFVEALRWSGVDVVRDGLTDGPGVECHPPARDAAQQADEIERALLARPVLVAVLSPASALAPGVQRAVEIGLRLQRSEPERLLLAVTAKPAALPVAWATVECYAAAEGGALAPVEAAQRVRARLAVATLDTPANSMPMMAVPDQAARARDAWERGKVLRAQGRAGEALSVYEQALAREPGLAPIWYSRGTLLAELERYDEALFALDRALEYDASLAIAWHARGRVYLALQMPHDALAAFEHALRINPAHALSWAGKGDAYAQSRRYADALDAYERALELDDSSADLWNQKGNLLQMLQRHPEARVARARPRTLGGDAPADDRDWDREALAAYERALDRDPTHALAWSNTIRLLEDMGRDRAARKARRARDNAREVEIAAQETRYTPRVDDLGDA